MPDAAFEDPRLIAIYDVLEGPARPDLDLYLDLALELGAHSVVDLGCGTGVLALRLAAQGLTVTGVDPARGSLEVARAKPDSDRVRWVHGDATALPGPVDLVTMTGNAAQAIIDPADWAQTLSGVHRALNPGGHFVFETRDPARRGWTEWNRADSYEVTEIPGGTVQTWVELTEVAEPLVSFRSSYVFAGDGAVLTSDSTLRFRSRAEVEADLAAAWFEVRDVRDAPDRPGREFVFLARPR